MNWFPPPDAVDTARLNNEEVAMGLAAAPKSRGLASSRLTITVVAEMSVDESVSETPPEITLRLIVPDEALRSSAVKPFASVMNCVLRPYVVLVVSESVLTSSGDAASPMAVLALSVSAPEISWPPAELIDPRSEVIDREPVGVTDTSPVKEKVPAA